MKCTKCGKEASVLYGTIGKVDYLCQECYAGCTINNNSIPQGWQCPICKNIYAPFITACHECNGKNKSQLLQPSIPGVVLPYTLTPNTFPNTGGVVAVPNTFTTLGDPNIGQAIGSTKAPVISQFPINM